MYRVNEKYLPYAPHYISSSNLFNPGSEENCILWRNQTTASASLDDIYQVVYKYSIDDLKSIGAPFPSKRNSFAKWLRKDKESLDFLILAKECETARAEMSSPWYYPSRKDPQKSSLEEIATRSISYEGKRFAERYFLQALRALHSLRRYDECINLWNSKVDYLPDNIITRMAAGYVAGAYVNIGDKERAAILFKQAGDIDSYLICENDSKCLYDIDLLDTQQVRSRIARTISHAQWYYGDLSKPEYEWLKTERDNLISIYDYCLKVVSDPKSSHKDFWYYNAAFIRHLFEDDDNASRLLSLAERYSGKDQVQAESIKVFRIYLDAKLTPYSSSYENRMVRNLAWLDDKIVEHYPECEAETISYGVYHMKCNISYFYWNDMMRKITLGVICPKLVKYHKGASAVAFANMADNRVFNLIGKIEGTSISEYRSSRSFNIYDYSNQFFDLMDTLTVDDLIEYEKSLDHPKNEAQTFLNQRGYTDRNYIREIIGTRLIREMRYSEAVKYLSMVPASFQYRLNTFKEEYFKYDPFSVTRKSSTDRIDCKLSFAKDMAAFQEEMKTQKDPDRKAAAMFLLATGMQNSVSTCWALSFYGRSYGDDNYEYGPTPVSEAQKKVFTRAEHLYMQALTTAEDPEILADMHLKLKNNRTVMEEYPGTNAWHSLLGRCDTYWDYHLDRKENYDRNLWKVQG